MSDSNAPVPFSVPVSDSGTSNPKIRWTCDRCETRYTISEAGFHCRICDGGDYDLCQTCAQSGLHCKSPHHRLFRRSVDSNTGSSVSDPLGSLEPKSIHEDDRANREYLLTVIQNIASDPEQNHWVDELSLADSTTTIFEYRPLREDNAETRLLHLQPSSSVYDPIVGNLHVVPLNNMPQYVTTNGPPAGRRMFDRVILCNGALLPLTTDLYGRLRKLRQWGFQWIFAWEVTACDRLSRDIIHMGGRCAHRVDMDRRHAARQHQ